MHIIQLCSAIQYQHHVNHVHNMPGLDITVCPLLSVIEQMGGLRWRWSNTQQIKAPPKGSDSDLPVTLMQTFYCMSFIFKNIEVSKGFLIQH